MKPRTALAVAVSVACAAAFSAGCRLAHDKVVAVVDGKYEVSAADLAFYVERAADAGGWPAGVDADVVARELLDAAVLGKILELEAAARGYDEDPYVKEELAAIRSRTLRDYMRRSIDESVVVTEAEVLDFFKKSRKRRMYSFIQADELARAREAHAALEAGRPWDEVVAEYSTFAAYAGGGGKWDVPMEYAADEASKALFDLAVGEHTGVVEGADGLSWFIYRADKVVHGFDESYDEARPRVRALLASRKGAERFRELARAWRKVAPLERNDELWRAIFSAPFAELRNDYGGKDLILSDVGGVPVYFDSALAAVEKFIYLPPEEVDRMRETKAERYERIWNNFLRDFEDEALLEYEALQEGVDQTPTFRREMALRRGDLLISKIYQEELLPTIPQPTDAEIGAYYEAHRDDFLVPERVEVYLVAMPDRGELERFYEEVKAGADTVVDGEARNRARAAARQELYELPPPPAPEEQEWLGVVAITAAPTSPNAPPDPPFAGELRPRVFPFEELHVLSEPFPLRDGRWAFYEPIYYQPAAQRGLDDAEVAYFCRKGVFEETVRSPGVSAAADEWLASLRARHDVVVDEAALAQVAARLRAARSGE
jgi:hypothetical protein